MNRSREIIEIVGDIVKATSEGCEITVSRVDAPDEVVSCPKINYIFGNAQYVKDRLDLMSKADSTNEMKFPLIALFVPFQEKRDVPRYFSQASVNILIACPSTVEWSNEERLAYSFQNILRPIYRRFMEELLNDGRIDFGYGDLQPHKYSENYSFGRYGAHTGSGEALSETIDAIVITELELKIKKNSCR